MSLTSKDGSSASKKRRQKVMTQEFQTYLKLPASGNTHWENVFVWISSALLKQVSLSSSLILLFFTLWGSLWAQKTDLFTRKISQKISSNCSWALSVLDKKQSEVNALWNGLSVDTRPSASAVSLCSLILYSPTVCYCRYIQSSLFLDVGVCRGFSNLHYSAVPTS